MFLCQYINIIFDILTHMCVEVPDLTPQQRKVERLNAWTQNFAKAQKEFLERISAKNTANLHIRGISRLLYKTVQLIAKSNVRNSAIIEKFKTIYVGQLPAEIGSVNGLKGVLEENLELLSKTTQEEMDIYVELLAISTLIVIPRLRFVTVLCTTEAVPVVPNQFKVKQISFFLTNVNSLWGKKFQLVVEFSQKMALFVETNETQQRQEN